MKLNQLVNGKIMKLIQKNTKKKKLFKIVMFNILIKISLILILIVMMEEFDQNQICQKSRKQI